MLTTNKNKYKCSLCNYDSNKKYNLDRHIKMVHKIINNENEEEAGNVSIEAGNISIFSPKVDSEAGKISIEAGKVSIDNKCPKCNKIFTRKTNLNKHIPLCKNISNILECSNCHRKFSHQSSLSRHKKDCIKNILTKDTNETKNDNKTIVNVQDNSNNTTNTTNNTTNNNINQTIIMNFPDGMSDNKFAFVKDHIAKDNYKLLEKMFINKLPREGFARYTYSILKRPENRMVHKTSPNTKYSKVRRNGIMEYETDKEVLPVLTHHMSCAALEDIHNYKDTVNKVKLNLIDILRFLDDVNTGNDENDNYEYAIEKIKVFILNLSQQLGIPTPDV